MNDNTQLDPFETALLAELRREVAEHPAPVTTAAPVRRPRRRRLLAGGATVVAASVVAVFGLGAGGGSPAYAVEKDSAGDVIVTVHRLDDAAGLEKALRAEGIDASVSYNAQGFGSTNGTGPDGRPLTELPPPPAGQGSQGGSTTVEGDGGSGASLTQADPQAPAAARPADDPCGLGADPATLTQDGSDWVLRIPADSPLQDRHVQIGTDSTGALSVAYAGDSLSSLCSMVTVNPSATQTDH